MQEEGVEVARKCFDGGGGGWREAGERGKHEMEGKKGGGRRDVSREESALIPQRQMMSPPPSPPPSRAALCVSFLKRQIDSCKFCSVLCKL